MERVCSANDLRQGVHVFFKRSSIVIWRTKNRFRDMDVKNDGGNGIC